MNMGENSFDVFILCSFRKPNAAHVIIRHSLQSERIHIDFFLTSIGPFFYLNVLAFQRLGCVSILRLKT